MIAIVSGVLQLSGQGDWQIGPRWLLQRVSLRQHLALWAGNRSNQAAGQGACTSSFCRDPLIVRRR